MMDDLKKNVEKCGKKSGVRANFHEEAGDRVRVGSEPSL
jgi:hypothetical protein